MCTVAKSKKKKKKKLFGWLIKIIHLPFFFFFHSLMPLSLSLSLSSLKLTLLTLVTDQRSLTQAHSLNSDHRPTKLAIDRSA